MNAFERCPGCGRGGMSFTYRDPGAQEKVIYVNECGAVQEETLEIYHTTPTATFAKCEKCKKRVRIEDLWDKKDLEK